MFSKVVSTLLEILGAIIKYAETWKDITIVSTLLEILVIFAPYKKCIESGCQFQPFLRF